MQAGQPDVLLVRDWLGLLLAEAKDNLVNAAPGDMPRLQGAAQAYQSMIRTFERPIRNTTKDTT